MPGAPKYPLEPLARLRAQQAEAAAVALAEAARRVARAEEDAARAETERREADSRSVAAREAVRAQAAAGGRVAELAGAFAWESRLTSERELHARAAEHARARVTEAHAGAERLRRALEQKVRERDVVDQHRARFVARAARRDEDARDEEAADIVAARGGGRTA